jgi:hypothetical protein
MNELSKTALPLSTKWVAWPAGNHVVCCAQTETLKQILLKSHRGSDKEPPLPITIENVSHIALNYLSKIWP